MKGIARAMLELPCGMTKMRRLVQVRDGQRWSEMDKENWKERPPIASEARLALEVYSGVDGES